MAEPVPPKPKSGINVGDLNSGRDVNVRLDRVAGGHQIEAGPGATVTIEESNKSHLSEKLLQRKRRYLLSNIKENWIEPFFEKSLHTHVISPEPLKNIEVTQLQHILFQKHDAQPQLMSNARAIDLFRHNSGNALLILGEPGSGKTTVLFELARSLVAQAEQDEREQIPVILNLSLWQPEQLILSEWLVAQLQEHYKVSLEVAKVWVRDEEIMPLLDGLDDVVESHRTSCIEAINLSSEF